MTQQLRPFEGLVAATFTPLMAGGFVNFAAIPDVVDELIMRGIVGAYILGSTGEGVSLTYDERCEVARAFVENAARRFPVIVQVGCDSIRQARQLATHAQEVGADAISSISPVYFRPDSVEVLVAAMEEVAAGAPELPFYYYHVPSVTGVSLDMCEFLRLGSARIPTLRGIKFTSTDVDEFRACVEFAGGQFEILWGVDEMLLEGLLVGARAAVGSTFNFATPIYQQLLAAFDAGDLEGALHHQERSQTLVDTFTPYGHRAAQKAIASMVGPDYGPCRLPLESLKMAQVDSLRKELEVIGFFEWSARLADTAA